MTVIPFPSKQKDPRADDQLRDVSSRAITIHAKQLVPKRMLLKHLSEQKAAASQKFSLPVHTLWDPLRHVMRAWAGDSSWEQATFRSEWGTTEAGAIRRLRNKRAIPTLLSDEPAPEAASQESRPLPDMHVADSLEARRQARQKAPSAWASALVFGLVMVILMLCGAIAFLAKERMLQPPQRPRATIAVDSSVLPAATPQETIVMDAGVLRRRRADTTTGVRPSQR